MKWVVSILITLTGVATSANVIDAKAIYEQQEWLLGN
jgi:hypothetical protein